MTRPDIFTAVQEQLGLKLEARKEPVEVLVVDHVEKTRRELSPPTAPAARRGLLIPPSPLQIHSPHWRQIFSFQIQHMRSKLPPDPCRLYYCALEMTCSTKLQSARANGSCSHGPVTAEGKQRSAQNATRHGLLTNTVVLEGESKERFEELLSSLTSEWQPRNATEAALVETMAVARWRYLRVLSLQKVEFDLEIARQPHGPNAASAALAFRHLADNSRVLDLLLRYEVSFDRQFTRALNALIKLRTTSAMAGQEEAKGAPAAQPPHDLEFPNEPKAPEAGAAQAPSPRRCPSKDETTAAPAAQPSHGLEFPNEPKPPEDGAVQHPSAADGARPSNSNEQAADGMQRG